MKKTTLISFIIIFSSHFLNAQTCTPANSPNLGEDKTVLVTCFRDVADLTVLYNTNGLTLQWDIPNPGTAPIGYHWLIATNSNGCKDTVYINVKQDVKKWIGTVDSNWHNPANWSGNSVPADKSHILIFGGTPNPCVISSKDASAASVRVLDGGAYKVTNNRKINITATCDTLPAYYETGTKTILIDNPTSQIIQSVDSDKVVFNGNTVQLQNLDTSNMIVSGIATNAPYGFLRKVKAIQKVGNVYTITTDNIPLEVAFKELFLDYSKTFYSSDTSQHRSAKTASETQFSVPINNLLLANELTVNGGLKITPSLTYSIDISNFHLNHAKIEASYDRILSLGINATGNLNDILVEREIYSNPLEPFVIPYTPFVVFPYFRVSIGAQGSLSTAFNASDVNTSNVKAYVEYANGNWGNGYERNTENTFNFTGINGNASLKVYVEPAIDFKLYDQDWAKGVISAPISVKGEGSVLPKPSCKLTAGIEAGASVNLQAFGWRFAPAYNPEIFKYEKALFECFKPKVTTQPFTNPCDSVIIASGNVTDSGSSRLIARGFCYSTSPDPTITDFKKENVFDTTDAIKGLGVYKDTILNLKPSSTYYLKAYAINKTDTAYGDVFSFKAPDSTFIDSRDGQRYRFRQIGSQIWMTQNLRYSSQNSACYNFFDDTYCDTYVLLYGRLYWFGGTADDIKSELLSQAPPGWHIPSDEEWTILSNYLGGEDIAGGKMKDSCSGLWLPPNIGANNTSGFTGLPGGRINDNYGSYDLNIGGYWWSSTPSESPPYQADLLIRGLSYDSPVLYKVEAFYSNAFSIRCIKD